MDIDLEPGMYIVAVSGGVDSVVLLDLLAKKTNVQLVVAHFDHGIRPDSSEDSAFVEALAHKYSLEFFSESGKLGQDASEALARQKRYAFLRHVKRQVAADAIITAHHEDDVIETALLNLLRGTNRKGLSSLRSTDEIKRPLLKMSKQSLISYARANSLAWHEDSTNQDEKYLRNYIRLKLVPQLSAEQRQHLLEILAQTQALNDTIDTLLAEQLERNKQSDTLDRQWFISLPHALAREIMAAWLRQYKAELERPMLERLVVAAKTKAVGKQVDVQGKLVLSIEKHKLALKALDR